MNLNRRVQPGRCYGLFGRNGAGKTTTMKCLLTLLRPQHGRVRVFGLDPVKQDVPVKHRLAYVPDQVAFYPWMTIRETLHYLASFRNHWNRRIEQELLDRFKLDASKPTGALSKGQRTQVARIPPSARRRNCWCWTNPLRASIRSFAASSSTP